MRKNRLATIILNATSLISFIVRLSIILPVYSEQEILIRIVDDLMKLVGNRLHEIILVVSPRSNAKSVAICRDLSKRPRLKLVFQEENPGLGRAVRQGFRLASGTHLLMMDSDGEMSPSSVPTMIAKMNETGSDMVVGSRWMKGGGVEGYDPIKYIFNRAFQLLFKVMFRSKLHDLTLGFKLMRRGIVDRMNFQSNFHDIALETTIKPIKRGFKVTEVPVTWRCRTTGVSKNSMTINFHYLLRGIRVLLHSFH